MKLSVRVWPTPSAWTAALALFRRVAVGAVGGDGDRAVGADLGAGGGHRQRIAGIDIGVVGQDVAGDRGNRVFRDHAVSALATGPSLVPVMVMVSVEVDVPPLPSEIV